jgi:hypothetical protein
MNETTCLTNADSYVNDKEKKVGIYNPLGKDLHLEGIVVKKNMPPI